MSLGHMMVIAGQDCHKLDRALAHVMPPKVMKSTQKEILRTSSWEASWIAAEDKQKRFEAPEFFFYLQELEKGNSALDALIL